MNLSPHDLDSSIKDVDSGAVTSSVDSFRSVICSSDDIAGIMGPTSFLPPCDSVPSSFFDHDFNSEECSRDNRDYFSARDTRDCCDDRDSECNLAPEMCFVDSSLQDRDILPTQRKKPTCVVGSLEGTRSGSCPFLYNRPQDLVYPSHSVRPTFSLSSRVYCSPLHGNSRDFPSGQHVRDDSKLSSLTGEDAFCIHHEHP